MKRRFIILVVACLAAIAPLAAQGHMGPPHHGPGGGLMPMLHQLNLTDAQKDQIRALMEAEHTAGPSKILELQQKLHTAVFAEAPDLQVIDALKTSLNAAHAEELDRHVEHLQKLAQILTPEQKQQLLTMASHRRGQ